MRRFRKKERGGEVANASIPTCSGKREKGGKEEKGIEGGNVKWQAGEAKRWRWREREGRDGG